VYLKKSEPILLITSSGDDPATISRSFIPHRIYSGAGLKCGVKISSIPNPPLEFTSYNSEGICAGPPPLEAKAKRTILDFSLAANYFKIIFPSFNYNTLSLCSKHKSNLDSSKLN
jgi:hypothetical protein